MNFLKQLRQTGARPAVVATIHTLAGLQAALRLPADAVDFLELRLDALAAGRDRLPPLLPKLKAPVILTVRHPLEGGAGNMQRAERRRLYEEFLPYVACIDIELRSLPALAEVVGAARARKLGVIISHHDFARTPSLPRLWTLAREAAGAGADVFKVAARTSSAADIVVLLTFLSRLKRLPLSVMGMGEFGKVSRLVFARAGSVLNYGYLDKSQVPGQWPALILKDRIGELLDDDRDGTRRR